MSRGRTLVAAALATTVAVLGAAGIGGAVDRLGNVGRAIGWALTSPERVNGLPFWAGSHRIAEQNVENALCLDFHGQGPKEADINGYVSTSTPHGITIDTVSSQMLSYIAGLLPNGTADTSANRDLAAAAAYATWGIAETVGFDEASSNGTPPWSAMWAAGSVTGEVLSDPSDPGSDPAAIESYYQAIKIGASSIYLGGGVGGFDSPAPVTFPVGVTTGTATFNAHAAGPLPLVPVTVTATTNVSGVAVGDVVRADSSGNVSWTVTLIDPAQPGTIEVSAAVPSGQITAWETPNSINGNPSQALVSSTPVPMSGSATFIPTSPPDTTTTTTSTTTTVPDTTTTTVPDTTTTTVPDTTTTTVPDTTTTSTTTTTTTTTTVAATTTSSTTTTVAPPATTVPAAPIELSTLVEHRVLGPGSVMTDSYALGGLLPAEDGATTVVFEVFNTLADPSCSSPLAHLEVTGAGNGTRQGVAPFTIPTGLTGPARFSYRERAITPLRATDWSECGLVDETSFVPWITTTAQAARTEPGDVLQDHTRVDGMPDGVKGDIVLNWFRIPADSTAPVCTTPANDTPIRYTLVGSGTALSPGWTIPADAQVADRYTAVEQLYVDGELVATHPCGLPGETVTVTLPFRLPSTGLNTLTALLAAVIASGAGIGLLVTRRIRRV